jgi:hypothetical protein
MLGPHRWHNASEYLMKDGKGNMVWDKSTTYPCMKIVMDKATPTTNEAEITFGMVKAFFIG